MWAHRVNLAAAVLTLCCAVARSDDAHKTPPADPDPGFLEFLGSVDRLADVNPDYLSQPDPPAATKPGARGATPALPSPPPPPPRQPLPPSASAASGEQKNE